MLTPGRGSGGEDGFAEFVRCELHAAAGQVEASADGLDQIREKICGQAARAEPQAPGRP
jgi:hypothetical protein